MQSRFALIFFLYRHCLVLIQILELMVVYYMRILAFTTAHVSLCAARDVV